MLSLLSGKIALVTGASRGIGFTAALELAKAGCHVIANYHKSHSEGEKLKEEINSTGRECMLFKADVSKSGQVKEMIQSAVKHFKSIDILVNNAGIARPKAIETITESDWDEVMAVNLKSCFLVTQAVLPLMRRQKSGRIINISSVAAQIGGVVGPHYSASKAGMIGLTHSYASLLTGQTINVNGGWYMS
jgi:3-oxoacyl-[acyl-carrier protein] reductase